MVATSTVAGADIDRDEPGSEPLHRSLASASSLTWSVHDANVSWAASRLQPQNHLLPWETGLAGEVFNLKRQRTLETISERP